MSNRFLFRLLIPFIFVFFYGTGKVLSQNLWLYTPYTKISVPPGESVNYTIEVGNNSEVIKSASLYVLGIPKKWVYTLKAGGWNIKQLSVMPGQKKDISLKINVPFAINKGNYNFRVIAGNSSLPITINVSEKGTFKTEFVSEQANMQGHAKSDFNFRAQLKNLTGEKQLYSLTSSAPKGWKVIFKPNYQQATSVEVEPNDKKDISIEVKPPYNVKAGIYKIPVRAITRATSANLDLEVVVTGTFDMELTTPGGLLSSDITAGRKKRIDLVVKNTGSTDLVNVTMSPGKPKGWEVAFYPDTIPVIQAGKLAQIRAEVKAYEKAIPGDYVINFMAKTPETSSKAVFRILVKTPMLWGWIGVFIIILTIAAIYFLFRKYGRR